MNTLTCEELRHYPGRTFTEQLKSHHDERRKPPEGAPAAASGASRGKPLRSVPGHGALSLGRCIDLRRFTGRDRVDRVVNYLRAHVPRTNAWDEDSLREVAARILSTADVIE